MSISQNIKIGLTFICLLFPNSPVYSVSAVKTDLTGIVHDGETDDPLENAVVRIVELNIYDITDTEGYFYFTKVESRRYTLEVSHIGYKTESINVSIGEEPRRDLVIHLSPLPFQTSTVIVTGDEHISGFADERDFSSILKGKELQKDMGMTIAATLKNETGLAIRSMGPAPSRPVIRGLSSDRVFIGEDSHKSKDLSATSPDHAVAVEPFTVERIEVIRGPKVLLKTPVTIGGVVNIIRNDIPGHIPASVNGNIGFYGETVNRGYLGALVTILPYDPFVLRTEFSGRKAGNLDTPVGILGNTEIETYNYSLGSSFIKDWGMVGFSYRDYDSDYGIPGGFIGAHPKGVDVQMLKRSVNGKFLFLIDNPLLKDISIDLNRTYYRHKELEANGSIGAEFVITDYSVDAVLRHNKAGFFTAGAFGISADIRDLKMGGYVFTPPTKAYNFSVYLYEDISWNDFSLQLAARYNYDRLEPHPGNPSTDIGIIRERIFNTYSLSAAGIYKLTGQFYTGATISRSSRVPTIEELYSEGPHLAAYSFEVGNPGLNPESGIGSEWFIRYKDENIYSSITLFWNEIVNYLIPRNTGEINYQQLLPIYKVSGVGAGLYGFEAQFDFRIFEQLKFTSSVSYTYGKNRDGNSPLPAIPPLKGIFEVEYNEGSLSAGITQELAAEQNNVDQFETPTRGYYLMNLYFQYSFFSGSMVHQLTLTMDNVLNKEYRNHLSRIKSIMPEAGRNLRFTYRFYF